MAVKDGLLDMLHDGAVALLGRSTDDDLPATVNVRPEHMIEIVAEIRLARGMTRTMRHWRDMGSEAPMTADELMQALCDVLDK